MKLSQILKQIKGDFQIIFNEEKLNEIELASLEIDSRLVEKNSAFFALSGKTTNGANFIQSALNKGASLIISSEFPQDLEKNSSAIFIKSQNSFEILVEFLRIFYTPLPQNIYAITGTNGKTSTAEFTRQILEFLGKKSASIGTLGVMCAHDLQHLKVSNLTTPDIVSLYKNLKFLKENSIDDVALEVSSIGLEQKRIAGVEIVVGAFTNFTQDHLDYHNSMAEYFRCKTLLFSEAMQRGNAVLNSDITEFGELKKISQKYHHNIIEYGFNASDLRLEKIEKIALGQKVSFKYHGENFTFDLSQSGDFQVMNALCALGNVLAKNNLSTESLKNLLKNFHKLQPALGRMQRVGILENNAQIFIDFAHSPDALENVLKLARTLTKSRVLLLFGCGGDRDAKKRPIMAKIACSMADFVLVTDDNPRSENAQNIRNEILAACDKNKAIDAGERRAAIAKAVSMLEADDILILAGKGHEKYQIIGSEKLPFDEEEIVANVIRAAS
jgi:UDP-N-acetylmuramoyl-L-alanyl-D-glutamate--2,6-diaminopimelate ligase